MKKDLVSVIVTTKNSEQFLDACLSSIKNQSYKNIELIVVDNNSTDATKEIAKKNTKQIFNKGPERSAQRNFGAKKAKGNFLLFIDSDMELSTRVVEECVKVARELLGGIIIPEESFGKGFWAKCKALERSYYEGTDVEAARFYPKRIFNEFKGFDENLTGPEDWDLSRRISDSYKIKRIKVKIRHNEGNLQLIYILKKKYYYAKTFANYMNKHKIPATTFQINPVSRFVLFFSKPLKLFRNPIEGVGMLFMKVAEYFVGGLAYISSKT
jgi:glycosyltransferase involved in cell wall biosynthesis